jgi:hypothetical protein
MAGRSTKLSLSACKRTVPLCVVLAATCAAWPVAAQQTVTIFDPELLSASQFGRGFSRSQLNPAPSTENEAIEAWGWLLSPYVSAGTVYDTNPGNASYNAKGQWGVRLQPGFSARRDTGIHNTRIYGAADLRAYEGGDYNQVTGYLGFTHRYEIMRDLVWRFQGEYGQYATRGSGGFGRSGVDYFRDAYFSTALLKGFDRFTIGGGASFSNSDPLSSFQSGGSTATVSLQSGYQLLPRLNGYITTEYDHVFNTSRDSSGYNATMGATYAITDLWNLNAYGGVATQEYTGTSIGSVTTPIFGATLSWTATPETSFILQARRRVGVAGITEFENQDYAQIVTDDGASLTGNWAFGSRITSQLRVGYDRRQFSQSDRVDNIFLAGGQLNWRFTNNVSFLLSNVYTTVDSNRPGKSYDRNVTTVGVRSNF